MCMLQSFAVDAEQLTGAFTPSHSIRKTIAKSMPPVQSQGYRAASLFVTAQFILQDTLSSYKTQGAVAK